MLRSRAVLVLITAAVIAAGAITGAGAVSISPTTLTTAGGTVSISGSLGGGQNASGAVQVTVTGPGGFSSVQNPGGTAPDCTYATSVTIPAGAAVGTYTVQVVSNIPPFGCEGEDSGTFQVTAAPPPTTTTTPTTPTPPQSSGRPSGSSGGKQGAEASAPEPIEATPRFTG